MFDETRFRQILREEIRAVLSERTTAVPEYLTPEQAAVFANVTPMTLRNWRKRGLKAAKEGKVVRYRRADLVAYMSRAPAQTIEEQAEAIWKGAADSG